MGSVKINNRKVGKGERVYFIADIASNHNGDLEHAKDLIYAGAESGVDAIKMQNFAAETIVSDHGFQTLEGVSTHQSKWKVSVFDSYKAASIPLDWTLELKELADKLGLAYFTSPYSLDLVRQVAPYISAFKLGSGDITWIEEIELMASYNKPVLIATGACNMTDVERAMGAALSKTEQVLLMQCNTNYTAHHGEPESATVDRLSNINLKVLESYSKIWPQVPLGLSDHTHGSLTVLGAVGLYDCCAVEKHFTLDSSLEGQDHAFSMMPDEWADMVEKTELVRTAITDDMSFDERKQVVRNHCDRPDWLELIIGDGIKSVTENEKNTIIVQRRSIRLLRDMQQGEVLKKEDLIFLRPCPVDGLPPYRMNDIIGTTLKRDLKAGNHITIDDQG